MNKEELYNDEDAYIKIINWPKILEIANIIIKTPYNCGSFWNNGFTIDKDIKNNLTYTYKYERNNETSARQIVLGCSNNRRLLIYWNFENYRPIPHITLKYKLNDKTMIFNIHFDNEYNITDLKINYNKIEFNNSFLTYYKKIIKYGKKEEAERVKNIHNKTVDNLIDNSFTEEELNKFVEKIKYYVDFEREKERVFLAIAGNGISR